MSADPTAPQPGIAPAAVPLEDLFGPARDPKLEELISSMLRGTCVPFLGAGMSCDADDRLRTSSLTQRLKDLVERCGGVPAPAIRDAKNCLSHWAELICQYYGPQAAVQAIGFETWGDIEPINAHRYLAFLVRERLIDEVITTNYDCLLEKALGQSVAPRVPTRAWPNVESPVIWDLLTYRGQAGKRGDRWCVLLRLIKLNGCAGGYAAAAARGEEDRGRMAQTIALTERQLQDWRRNLWSEQMFRDHLRSRRLLFVGFGSDDPMVRHTALQVAEEFAADPRDRAPGPDLPCPPCHLPNAPFVSEVSELRFNQRQVLARFCLAHKCGQGKQATGSLENAVRANASASDVGGPQTANEFWEEVYVRAIRRLWLERHFGEDSPLAHYLAPLVHSADSVLAATREAITGGRGADAPRLFWERFADPFRLTGAGGSLLSAAHLAAAGAASAGRPEAYVAFADEPVGLPMLYLLWLLLYNAVRLSRSPEMPPLPLELPPHVPVPDLSGARIGDLTPAHEAPRARRKVVCRFGDPGLDALQPLVDPEDTCNHLLLITLDGRRRQPRRILRSSGRLPLGPESGQLRPQVVFVVPDALLLARASREYRRSGIRGLLRGLYRILLDPELLRNESLGWEDWCERRPHVRRAG